jgi:hypothetical protein
MMPQVVTVKVTDDGKRFRIWVPLIPVLIVLSPILVLAALVLAVACLVLRINPFAAFARTYRLYAALRGLHIEINEGRSTFLITVT